MATLIGKLLGTIINVIGVVLMTPFAIIGGIFQGIARGKSSERNRHNGADIRALCTELGVPSNAYSRIVLNQMDTAKAFAMKIGEPGQRHYSSPWNTRLALAIAAIYEDENQQSPDLNDLVRALQTFISDYKHRNGLLPSQILLDHKIHMMFAEAQIYKNAKQLFGDIQFIPTAGIEGRMMWKAIDPPNDNQVMDDFDDDRTVLRFNSEPNN